MEIVSTGGTSRELAARRHRGARDRGLHRLPRDHGRAREDAPPAPLRGAARAPRRRRPPAGSRRAADRAGRPRVRQPLPVRADRRPRRRERGRGDREHRHRRPDDDPRGRQEPRLRGRRGRSGGLRARARRAARVRRQALAADAPTARGEGVRLHRALRRRDLGLVRAARLRGLPADVGRRLREGHRPALRREPSPAGRLLRAGRLADAPARRRQAAARQGAVVQQPARPQLGARARRGLRRAGLRDRQAQQPLRLRGRRRAPSSPTSGPSRATRRAPTAA